MNRKYIKIKKTAVPALTAVIIASQLMGCAAASQSELLTMLNKGETIEIEVAEPSFSTQEQGTENSLTWEELASLTTNPDIRKSWDDILLITKTQTGKNGVLYVNADGQNENNNVLREALHNRAFLKSLEDEAAIRKLADAVRGRYADIDTDNDMKAVYMGINAYFNLLPDSENGYCNADATIQRNEFMAMLMRAETQVGTLEEDNAFKQAVGQSEFNIYAQEIAPDSYLDTASKSLNNLTYNGSITRAEAVYILMNRYFSDELAGIDTKGITLNDVKDGGNIAEAQKFIENGTAKDYYKSYELTYALQNADKGAPSGLYEALVLACNKGLIGSETRWDEALTRGEAVELLVETLKQERGIGLFSYAQGATINDTEDERERPNYAEAQSDGTEQEDFKLIEMSMEMRATENADTYAMPNKGEAKSVVQQDEIVNVVGKVDGYNWYKIVQVDGIGSYIDGVYLAEIEQEQPKQETQTQEQAQQTQPKQEQAQETQTQEQAQQTQPKQETQTQEQVQQTQETTPTQSSGNGHYDINPATGEEYKPGEVTEAGLIISEDFTELSKSWGEY